jgi:hypothetical protein
MDALTNETVLLSRRRALCSTASLVASLASGRWSVASAAAVPSASFSLAKEFPNARLLCVSPDGKKLCLEDWKAGGYPVRVVEAATWRTLYTGNFQIRALVVDFFSDSEALFLDFAGGKGQLSHRQIAVNIQNGERTERMRAFDPFEYFEQMSPIDDRVLLVARYAQRPHKLQWLSRVEFPSYKQLARVDVATEQADSTPSAQVSLSADRSVAAYFCGNALTCRRTADLEVLWSHSMESDLRALPSVSAHGDFLAAAIAKAVWDGKFEHHKRLYISVYAIKTGTEIARLPQTGNEGFAISPDGTLLAVVNGEPGKKGEILPTVHIHEVSSGTRIASLVHDRVPSGRRQFLLAGCGVSFTSDSRYLITSGMVTKVWSIGA